MPCARKIWPTTFTWRAMARRPWSFSSAMEPHAERSFERPPRLILLDLKLPKVDGMEVLKRLKADARTKTIPVVILTSSKEERDLVNGYNLGANSYIQKPVDFDQFRETVKNVGLYWLLINQPPVPDGLGPHGGAGTVAK